MDGKSELLNLIVQTLINITAEMDMKFHKHQKKNYSSPKQHTQRNEIWPNVDVHC